MQRAAFGAALAGGDDGLRRRLAAAEDALADVQAAMKRAETAFDAASDHFAAAEQAWAPPLVELSIGVVGHLLAWEKVEADGMWWAWVSWVQESGGRHVHKVVQVPAGGLRPLEAPEAYTQVPRRVLGLDGQIRDIS